jgi:hypothetical protein
MRGKSTTSHRLRGHQVQARIARGEVNMDSHKEPVKVPTMREAFVPREKNARGPGAAEKRDPAILVL